MGKSRTKNVSINIIVALVCQIINLIISFVLRTVFVRKLGADYLGVNGLYTNILDILSFAELGIGNAIVFSMYRPLIDKDNDKLSSLLLLYKKAYNIIALVITLTGLMVVPFLDIIIKDAPDVKENLTLIYMLFLASTVASYLFAYKQSILIADQRNYIVLAIKQGTHIVQTIVQIVSLLVWNDYILFLILMIFFNLLKNILSSLIANYFYPFIKYTAKPIAKKESKEIFANVRDLTMYKIGSIVLNSTDNILVSSLVGITQVGLLSNYSLILAAAGSILGNITNSFTASIGNLNAFREKDKEYEVFNEVLFVTAWMYGFASIGIFVAVDYLIPLWIGQEYLLNRFCSFALVLGFYVQGVHTVESTFRTTLGYFKDGRVSPIISAILNIALSVLFCQKWGMAGIFIATPVARIASIGVFDTYILYKKEFLVTPLQYIYKNLIFLLAFFFIGGLCEYIVKAIPLTGLLGLIIRILAVTVTFNCIMLILFCKTKEMNSLRQRAKHLLGGEKNE